MAKLPTWDDVKKVADDLEKKVQGAGASMKERWHSQMKPKLVELQKKAEEKGHRASEAVQEQLVTLSEALKKFGNDISEDLKIGKKPAEAKPEEPKPEEPKPADDASKPTP
jgi:hypothetical protein